MSKFKISLLNDFLRLSIDHFFSMSFWHCIDDMLAFIRSWNACLFSLFCLLSITGCGSPSQFSRILNIPGEDSNFGLLPGQGFNPVDNTVKGNCVKLGGLVTQSGNLTGQTTEYRLLEITSEQSLRESLNVNASASFTGAVGRANARASFAQSVNKNNQSRYLLVHVRVSNQIELASSFIFSDSAQRLLKSSDSQNFLRQCGSEFVYGRRTGGEFFAVFEFSFSSTEEDRAFSTAVSGSGMGWKASANINSELSKLGRFASTQVKLYKVGGDSGLPDIGSLADFSNKFDSLVSSARQGAVTLELLTKGYEGVEPLDLKPNAELLVKQRYVMEQLALNRDSARELLNSIRFIKSNRASYGPMNDAQLDEGELKLAVYLNTLNDAAVECFANVSSGCKLPTMVLPDVTLPTKKSGLTCRIVQMPVCSIPDSDNTCIAYGFKTQRVCH